MLYIEVCTAEGQNVILRIVSVVSYDLRMSDTKYQTAGVREYWIVDPIKELVTVYQFEKETMEQYSFETDVPVGIYDDFFIKIQ